MPEIVFTSKKMEEVVELANQIAASDASVVIQGETGTGKNLIAQVIHHNSSRLGRPFVAVDCGALSPTLIESELFGHVKGAFTGAASSRRGLFEEADGGTLFLDEISEMPFDLQAKLLGVCQYRQIRRLGCNQPIQLNVRILAATNQDVAALIRSGKFRQDLYYRLNIVSISIPPLRERREDIAPLVCRYLAKLRTKAGSTAFSISTEAMDAFLDYSWPGNVRELENVIERATVFAKSDLIQLRNLPEELRTRCSRRRDSLSLTLRDNEGQHILEILEQNNGNQTRTAEMLGISYSTLWRKLKKINGKLARREETVFRNSQENPADSECGAIYVA